MAAQPCPRCGRDSDPSFAYCQGCGQALRPPPKVAPPQPARVDRRCPACMAPIEQGYKFCGHCGRALPAAPRPEPMLTPPPVLARVAYAGPATPADAADPVGSSELPSPAASASDPAAPDSPTRPSPMDAAAVAAQAEGTREVAYGPLRASRLVPMRHDGLPGPVLPLGSEFVVCGRTRGQLRFEDDATVSPEHARFEFRSDVLYVEDLGSLNGTFLRLRGPRTLLAGDEIRLGRQVLRVEPMPRAPEGPGSRPWGSPELGYRVRLVQTLEGGGDGEVFPLVQGENTIGREVARVCFPGDRFVSARHARIDVGPTGILLTDVGSSNGTFVRIAAPEPLVPGDQVLVGLQLIRVE